MGELSGMPDFDQKAPEKEVETPEKVEIPTDVEGVFADDVVKHGKEEIPVFDCEEKEFYGNMKSDRKRLRFKNGSAAAKYMNNTKYNRPFFIRTKTASGEVYTRKIK